MIHTFAENQIMLDTDGVTMLLTTEPVSVGGNLKGNAVFIIHHVQNAGVNTSLLTAAVEGSNDGVSWVADPLTTSDPMASDATFEGNFEAQYQFVRLSFLFNGKDSGTDPGLAYIAFDCHVRFYTT